MAEFLRASIADIHIGERLRPIDADYVEAIAASMAEHGQISPIMIRRTPAKNKGATPYTLVAGGYRTTAAKLLGWAEIDAIVVAADQTEAQLLEISENLFRNELSALDRSIFVMKYRELHEEKHGQVQQGGDRKSKSNDWTLMTASGKELSERVQERLGIGRSTYFNVSKIGQSLSPALRAAVRGTSAENDQGLLLKLAKMPPDEQQRIAAALKQEPDVKKVLAAIKPDAPAPAVDMGAALLQPFLFKRLTSDWQRADPDTRAKFLRAIGMEAFEPFGEAA